MVKIEDQKMKWNIVPQGNNWLLRDRKHLTYNSISEPGVEKSVSDRNSSNQIRYSEENSEAVQKRKEDGCRLLEAQPSLERPLKSYLYVKYCVIIGILVIADNSLIKFKNVNTTNKYVQFHSLYLSIVLVNLKVLRLPLFCNFNCTPVLTVAKTVPSKYLKSISNFIQYQ